MTYLFTYDVDFSHESGKKRLRKVARICERYGVRVQNSVFEMMLDPAQLASVKNEIISVIDEAQDSIRIYKLGKNREKYVEIIGYEKGFDQEGTLIL